MNYVLEVDSAMRYRFRPTGRHERRPSRWPIVGDVLVGLVLVLALQHT